MAAGLSEVNAIILAGGLGTRIAPVLGDRPKCLAPVAGRPFLDHLLAALAARGVRRATVSAGYLADAVVRHVDGLAIAGIEVACLVEPEPLGTGGAVRFIHKRLGEETYLVLNGDTYLAADLAAFAAFHRVMGTEVSMAVVGVEDTGRFGRVEIGSDHRLASFGEKAGHGPGWINAGVYLLERALLERFPSTVPCSLEYDVLERLPGGSVAVWETHGTFIDIGTPESLEAAQGLFADGGVSR